MAVESDCTLKDTSINSGVAVDLNATHVKWVWKNFLNSVQGPGKDSSSLTRNQRLAKNVLLGFDNPDYIVNCQVDLDDTVSNRLTFTLIKAFAESTNTKTLSSSAYGSVVVDIDGIIADVDFPSTKGKKMAIVMTFREAQV